MNTLHLTQVTHDGRIKTWRINDGSEPLTFGTSRKARIVSIDNSIDTIESILEYRDEKWHYIHFKSDSTAADTVIESHHSVQLHHSLLNFEVKDAKNSLMNGFDQLRLNGPIQKQLVVVTKNNLVLQVHLKNISDVFEIFSSGRIQRLTMPVSGNWCSENLDNFTIKFKTLNVDETSSMEISKNYIMEKEDKKAVVAILSLTSLIIFTSFLFPKNDLQISRQHPNSTNVVVKSELKRKPKSESRPTTRLEPTAARNSDPSGGAKTAAHIKNSIGARISKLIGKVSATEARTANVILTTNGVKAGENSSGRALAAVGKIESSGRNWSGEAVGKQQGISTAGIGGGNGSGGLRGSLAQGNTGAGGVGLIEDESEIVGGLDREVIAQYIKTQLGQILYCYERQLSANPNLVGKIAVKFTIAGSGQVEAQSINDSTLKNSSVESCILNKISKWKFPEPKGGTKVLVTYPFLFKSTI